MAAEDCGVGTLYTQRELAAHGESIARQLRAPSLVTLSGDLGAGKTTLAQAICRGLGVTEPVTSPTFALIHEYRANGVRVVHCDLYRVSTAQEIAGLGLDEMREDGETVMLVEWPARAGEVLAAPALAIELAHVPSDPTRRHCREVWSR